jgi:hypothetical protein
MGLQPLTADEVPQMEKLGLRYTIQQKSMLDREEIRQWIEEGGYTKIALHWDLDVLDPTEYHSLYFNINSRVKSTVFQTVKLSVAYPKKGKASILSMR